MGGWVSPVAIASCRQSTQTYRRKRLWDDEKPLGSPSSFLPVAAKLGFVFTAVRYSSPSSAPLGSLSMDIYVPAALFRHEQESQAIG